MGTLLVPGTIGLFVLAQNLESELADKSLLEGDGWREEGLLGDKDSLIGADMYRHWSGASSHHEQS